MSGEERIALPSVSVPVIDRFRRWSPAWWKWVKPAIEAVNDHTAQLSAVATNLDTVNAAITLEQSVRADADAAIATSVSELRTEFENADAVSGATFIAALTAESTARAAADGALASQIDTIEAAYQLADATLETGLTTEASARASADGALSDLIVTIQAGYQSGDSSLSAQIVSEQAARIAADGVNASAVSTLTTTVDSHTTSLTTYGTSINGLQAKWGVTINANKRITGLTLNSGLDNTTTFAVLADKFTIVHPTNDGLTAQAFQAGLVNNVATVGINGNLIVDNTITANAINVTTLSALTANLGTVTAGVIQNPAGTLKFDLPNMRLYRTDGKVDINLSTGTMLFQP